MRLKEILPESYKPSTRAIYLCEGSYYSKNILLEQKLYEGFLDSAQQYLGDKFNQTMGNIKGQVTDFVNAGIIIKDVLSNDQLLANVTSQIRKWTNGMVKTVSQTIQQIGASLNAPELAQKLITAWQAIAQKVQEVTANGGWKGFLGSLGIYGVVKFVADTLANASSLKSALVGGAFDALVSKAQEVGTSLLGNVTMPGFFAMFEKLGAVKKYFLDVLSQVKSKFSSVKVAGTAQFSS